MQVVAAKTTFSQSKPLQAGCHHGATYQVESHPPRSTLPPVITANVCIHQSRLWATKLPTDNDYITCTYEIYLFWRLSLISHGKAAVLDRNDPHEIEFVSVWCHIGDGQGRFLEGAIFPRPCFVSYSTSCSLFRTTWTTHMQLQSIHLSTNLKFSFHSSRACNSPDSFGRHLKTRYFQQVFFPYRASDSTFVDTVHDYKFTSLSSLLTLKC